MAYDEPRFRTCMTHNVVNCPLCSGERMAGVAENHKLNYGPVEPRKCKVCNETWAYHNVAYGKDEYAKCHKCGRHTKSCVSISEIFEELDLDRVIPPYSSADADPVKNPSHYCINGYECSKVAEAIGLVENAYLFNIFKYIWRCRKKGNEKQDLEKIIQYAEMRIAQLEKQSETHEG